MSGCCRLCLAAVGCVWLLYAVSGCCRTELKLSLLQLKTEVLRGVFRRLIIGSGLDWAAHDDLATKLIQLGKALPPDTT